MSMSIGKALLERSAVNAKITDIISRINNNAVSTKTDNGTISPTTENPVELMATLGSLEKHYEDISNAILNANYSTIVECDSREYKLIEIIEKIDFLGKKIKRIKDLIAHIESQIMAKKQKNRYDFGSNDNKNETTVSLFEISDLRRKLDKLCGEKNKFQVVLQEINWSKQITL